MTNTVFLLIWMLIALSPLCYCYDAGNITNYYTPFNGGTNCGSHCPSGYTYMGDYACSDGRGAWNGGAFHFQDHIPSNQGYVLHKFSITIYLTYCNTSTVLILLGGMYCMCCQWCIGDGAKPSFRCSVWWRISGCYKHYKLLMSKLCGSRYICKCNGWGRIGWLSLPADKYYCIPSSDNTYL